VIDFTVASSHADYRRAFIQYAWDARRESRRPGARVHDLDDAEIAALMQWDAGLDGHPDDGELDHEQWAALCRAADRTRLHKVRKPVEDQTRNSQAAPSRRDFLAALFAHTTGPTYVCSFPNERDDPKQASERHLIGRSPTAIDKFLAKWDKPGRGAFVCVGTLKEGAQRRAKENIAETICLHADIDFKNVDSLGADPRAHALRQLARLKYQPSIIVFSGGGLHAYWLFREPIETQGNIERIELALRQLADVVAGDLSVCEVSRVMRLPGTHNTKEATLRVAGGRQLVEVLELHPERRFELDDLEEWFSEQSPVMLRKSRERAKAVGEVDDEFKWFEDYAKRIGIKAPVDVEARLKRMIYMGGDEDGIHITQIQCSAALLSRGVPVDEVVPYILEATKIAAGEYGERWNWEREKKKIRRDCESWVKKHPPEERKKKAEPKLTTIEGGKSETRPVVSGNNAVAAVITPKPGELHIEVAKAVLVAMQANGEELIITKDGAWFYSKKGVWELRTDDSWLTVRVETSCVGMGFKSNTKLRNEARNWIRARPELWRDDELPWDQHGKIPTRSGLVDPMTGELEPARPDHFCTWRINCDYDPNATCPWWETYLNDLFVGDDQARKENIRVIQEVLGAALIDKKPRGISKAFIAQGESNTGKSGLVDVLGGMFGASNEITTPLDALEGAHGLMPFAKRGPWVLHEAFRPGKWHPAPDVKAIITHNPVQINVKNGPMLRAVVRSPIFWATNYLPQFKETTKAIVSRIIVIRCNRIFEEGAPLVGAAAEARRVGYAEPSHFLLATEMAGILNWAIAGLRRALERGFIELSDSIRATANEIRRDANAVAGFLDDCIEFNKHGMLSIPDFCLAFSVWDEEQRGESGRQWGNKEIGKFVGSLGDPRIAIDAELRVSARRYYGGIMLNDTGMSYHRQGVESRLFDRKSSLATTNQGEVNKLIPLSWDNKPAVMAMREHHCRLENRTPDVFDGIDDKAKDPR
jgi:P4 family phage/plasmid primase-like protien